MARHRRYEKALTGTKHKYISGTFDNTSKETAQTQHTS